MTWFPRYCENKTCMEQASLVCSFCLGQFCSNDVIRVRIHWPDEPAEARLCCQECYIPELRSFARRAIRMEIR